MNLPLLSRERPEMEEGVIASQLEELPQCRMICGCIDRESSPRVYES